MFSKVVVLVVINHIMQVTLLSNDTDRVFWMPESPRPIGNIVDDLKAGLVDWVVHAGDHAYEFPVASGQRGDAYMDAYQPLLALAPWAPGWGNHEFLEGDRGNRLLNITAGMTRGGAAGVFVGGGRTVSRPPLNSTRTRFFSIEKASGVCILSVFCGVDNPTLIRFRSSV